MPLIAPVDRGMGRRILLTGADGQLGRELMASLMPLGVVHAYNRAALDLADADAIGKVVQTLAPDVIVNAGAYTAVDQAEKEADLAEKVNAVAPGVLAEHARASGALLVHYSTDYVFDGAAERPYREGDAPVPVNVYGRTKLAGEQAALAANEATVVIRTSWVYGMRGHNFLLTMQRLAREHGSLRVVEDQFGAPTWTRYLADSTTALLTRLIAQPERVRELRGLYHLSSAGCVSWCEFARAIMAGTPGLETVEVVGIPTSAYPTPAVRPRYSLLDTTRIVKNFGLHTPDWRDMLRVALREGAANS